MKKYKSFNGTFTLKHTPIIPEQTSRGVKSVRQQHKGLSILVSPRKQTIMPFSASFTTAPKGSLISTKILISRQFYFFRLFILMLA